MYDDPWSSFDFDNVSANLPSVTPPPLESFEEMLNALERENLDVHVNVQFPAMTQPLPDISFPTVASTRSQSTYSVPGLTDTGNTEYSFMSTSSNYPPPSNPARRDIVLGFEYNNVLDKVDPKHSPAISQSTTPMFPPFQHDHVFNAQDGPDRQLVGISPHCLSAAIASPPPAIPSDPSASIASTTRVFTGPIRTKHTKKPKEPTCNQCDQCGRVFDRKSNLTSHMKTHDPNRERPFVCPKSDCVHRFTRSHDLKRHLMNTNIHGVRAE